MEYGKLKIVKFVAVKFVVVFPFKTYFCKEGGGYDEPRAVLTVSLQGLYYIHMATTDSTIQFRVDAKTKRESKKIFAEFGLDMSSALKLFLHATIRTKSVPVELRTENGFTPAYEKMLIAETADALKNGKRYTDLDELFTDLDLK